MSVNQYCLKQVRVFDPTLGLDQVSDVKIESGKISEIAPQISVDSQFEIIDGKDKVLFPGFVDLHTHLREPGFEYKETIETGTRAAVAGGFTAVCCMANTQPVNDQASVTHYILEQAQKTASCQVWPIGAISQNLEGKTLAEIGELKRAGCVAISDDGKTVMDSQLMRRAMDYAKGFEIPVITHCIDDCLGHGGVMHEGKVSCQLGLKGIPAQAEEIIISRDILLSELTGCHLHIAHVSTATGVEFIRQAKAKGLPVTGEAAPHHWTLTDEACLDFATNAKMCPPLRSQEDVEAVVQGLADGTLDVIATDHAPHALTDKEVEFDQAAFGILGFETAFALAYRLVLQNRMDLATLIRSLTSNPVKILKKDYHGLRQEMPANLTLVDLNQSWTYRVSESYSKSRNSPFDGWDFQGKVIATWVSGKKVYG